jgi:PKD repeat protein
VQLTFTTCGEAYFESNKSLTKDLIMRKFYQLTLLLFISSFAWAQGPFFTVTSYRGAFAPAPAAMWTDTWTEWDPQNKNYGTPGVDVTTDITTNTTWTSNNVYHLKGIIYVKNGATLTIQPGTVIMGDKATPNSSLVITKGAKIMAAGTAASPIVFTSNQPATQRNLGDWGGIILLGKAINNNASGIGNIEGIAPTTDTEYGGTDDNDNSGTLQYVRVEFAGYVFQPGKEINGITFGSVGRGTVIDHVQVSFSNDDGYEWFGGAVNCKYLVSYRNLDDDFDTDNGFSGSVQFGLSVRDPLVADDPAVSTSEGFESDNDPTGTAATPQTKALFSNMTLIGPYRGSTANVVAAGYRRGARIRRNSALKIFNSIFMDHVRGLHIDGTASEGNATNNLLKFSNNIVAGNATGFVCEVNSGSVFGIRTWFGTSNNDSLTTSANILTTPYNYTAPDYRPAAGSPALTKSTFTDAAFNGLVIAINPVANFFYTQDNTPGSRAINFNNSTNEKGYTTTYSWDFGVPGAVSTAKNPTYTYTTDGNYTVKMVATGQFGKDSITKQITVFATATNPFFAPTSYRGAFAPAPNAMWTNGWTEFDPQNKNYGTSNTDVTSDITTNTTWTSDKVYLIKGIIYVSNNATLTIQPGTVIMGDKATPNSSLVITKGAKLMAAGTLASPIVFTSNQPATQRNLGDWGGIILLGKASNNNPSGTGNIEGIAPTTNTEYGGGLSPVDNDNSGVLQYVRIEFGGYVFQPGKEINGLTLGAVGSGTTIDHVQVSFSNDDAYEWFGGTVNCKYLVSYRNLDDDFDTDNGFSGFVQFGLSVRDPLIADDPAVSTSEGFESDNDPTGSTANPQTRALFSNMTLIGPYRGNTGNTVAAGYRRGARIRRNSALKIFNSIFMDHVRGVHIDGTAAEGNATNNLLMFKHNLVAGNSTGLVCEVNSGSAFGIRTWFGTSNNDSLTTSANILTTPYNYTAPDYRPAVASPALNTADFFDAAFTGLIANAQQPEAAFTYEQDNTTGSRKLDFTNTTDEKGNSVIYLWDFGVSGSTTDSSTSKDASFTYTQNGVYTVTLIAFSAAGNDTTTMEIIVFPTAVKEVASDLTGAVKVYPNPAAGNVSVDFTLTRSADVEINVIDITGRVVKHVANENFNNGQNTVNFDMADVNNGFYFINIKSSTGSKTVRLMISK